MNTIERYLLHVAAVTTLFVPAFAQTEGRQATFTGRGGDENGKCTIEVYVDGAAEVEIRGDRGFLRTLSGQPAQWRRFECSGPIPANTRDVQFVGVDGRGRQELVQNQRAGGGIVVRIQDPDSGAEGYTFDLVWRGGGGDRGPTARPFGGNDRGPMPYESSSNNNNAVRSCQEAVRRQANQQYGLRDIDFGGLDSDENAGRDEKIMGSFNVRGGNYGSTYHFSCAVDQADGDVRRVEITQQKVERTGECQRAAAQRIQRDGYRNVQFGSLNSDSRRNGWIGGIATAQRGNNPRSYDFDISCSINNANGNIQSVQATRRY